jgi:hypothetical protein
MVDMVDGPSRDDQCTIGEAVATLTWATVASDMQKKAEDIL